MVTAEPAAVAGVEVTAALSYLFGGVVVPSVRPGPCAVKGARGARGPAARVAAVPGGVRQGPVRNNARMRISARADYAVRAALQLAAARDAGPLKAEAIAEGQGISHKFLEGILGDMRKGGLVQSQRGGNGGYWLARPAETISVAEVIRCVDGPLVSVRGERPPDLAYTGPAESLLPLWIALRASVRAVLGVSLAEVAAAELPAEITALTQDPEAWTNP
ncbi:hypothetical protein GCM10022244_55920 [Streptomyces gulbargensis]|uniref:Transcriptional regulator n=2 Tax=Streptomyces gulbargensis TaxID=364901 RepID=A0ABP7NBS4_9ACTN